MRVVIAEDMVLLRDGVSRALISHGLDVVGEAGDAPGLVDAVAYHRPDLVVADVRMPPTFTDEGARAVRLLRDRYPELAVMMLSHSVEPDLALLLASERPAGFGYLLKDRVMEVDEFVRALREVAAGGTVVDPVVVERGLSRNSGPLGVLTARERGVLAELARGDSNVAIARTLSVSERTVDAHVRSIFTKLDLPPAADANRRVQVALLWLASTGDGA